MQSSRSFIRSYLRKLPVGLTVLVLLFGGAIFFFTYLVHQVFRENEVAADKVIFDALANDVINPGLTHFMKTVTFFASSTFLQIGYALLVLLYAVQKNVKRSVEIAVIGLGGFLVNYFMKLSFQRVRPPNPLIDPLNNFSFPSGHATSAFIFYGLLAYLIWKTTMAKPYKYIAGGLLLFFSLLIGFSRVYLRVHYPSDVAAGFCIGFAWLLLTIYLFERLKKKSAQEQKGQLRNRKA